ncbi:MAG TPA: SDR family oxidoreductase [Vicinamibacterales bacterium]|nr:SDR family oxidoreductase [Vicinamibacterales bacterium]
MTALITGASSGIGRSLALLFARNGYDVLLVARREEALRELAGEITSIGRTARVIPIDLAVNGGAQRLFDQLAREGVRVDVLVNNAGVGAMGTVAEIPLDRQLAMIELNITTLTILTRLLLPGMLERRAGGVLNVGSTASFQPGPLMAVYYASKAYVLSFTEALAEEVTGSGVKVCCLAPGPTHTGFAREASMETSRLFSLGAMSADEVARIGFEGWTAGKRLVVAGTMNRIGALTVRFAPRALALKVTKRLNASR